MIKILAIALPIIILLIGEYSGLECAIFAGDKGSEAMIKSISIVMMLISIPISIKFKRLYLALSLAAIIAVIAYLLCLDSDNLLIAAAEMLVLIYVVKHHHR